MPKIAYKLVFDDLMRLIKGKYIQENEMLQPENTLALRYNVSRPTIRKVLQMLADESLIVSKAGIGWQVCSPENGHVKKKNPNQLLIGVDTAPDIWGYFYYDLIMNGIKKAADECGCRLVVANHYDPEQFKPEEPDGLILSKTTDEIYRQCTPLAEKGVPIVFINRKPENPLFSYCGVDYTKEARRAVEYLLLLGHRNIAAIGGSDLGISRLRYNGWYQAFTANGLRPPENLYMPQLKTQELMEALKKNRPTAAFLTQGASAVTFLLATERAGLRIPDDISVICFDDMSDHQVVDIPISHIRMPLNAMGQRAVQYIVKHAENPKLPPLHLTMEADLVINSSCKNINREKIKTAL